VFLPLLAMGGVVGRLFREFSVTLATAVVLSALISLTVTPMVAARLAPARNAPGPLRPHLRGDAGCHGRWLHAQPGRRAALPALHAAADARAGRLTVWLYIVVPKGFFPEQDTGLLRGTVQASTDTSFAAMQVLHARAADIIRADPAVTNISGSIGSGFNSSSNSGQFFISLKPLGERPPINDVIAPAAPAALHHPRRLRLPALGCRS
jgi:multidrug efflux pump subunit AcrB